MTALKPSAKPMKKPEKTQGPFSGKFRTFYHSKDAQDPNMLGKTTPTGAHNMRVFKDFRSMKRFRALFEKCKDQFIAEQGEFRVLLDGFSSPFNVLAMNDFLVSELGIPQKLIKITAIDLSDDAVPEAKELAIQNGINFSFELADARELPFSNGFFHLVFQDFLLNCAPLHMHSEILNETSRILFPNFGLALIGWTSAEGHLSSRSIGLHDLSSISGTDLSEALELIQDTFSISDIDSNSVLSRRLRVLNESEFASLIDVDHETGFGPFVLIVPGGDFEFLRLNFEMMQLFSLSRMHLLEMSLDVGKDRNEFACWRNRFVLTHNPDVMGIENLDLLKVG